MLAFVVAIVAQPEAADAKTRPRRLKETEKSINVRFAADFGRQIQLREQSQQQQQPSPYINAPCELRNLAFAVCKAAYRGICASWSPSKSNFFAFCNLFCILGGTKFIIHHVLLLVRVDAS